MYAYVDLDVYVCIYMCICKYMYVYPNVPPTRKIALE